MELKELTNIIQVYDQKITENNRLNRKILQRVLTHKPEKRVNKDKLRAGFYVLSPLILCFIITITNTKFQLVPRFYMGLGIFISAYLLTYVWDVKYFLLLCKVNFSSPILLLKKQTAQLEKCRIKTLRIRYLLMPPAIVGFLMMLFPQAALHTEMAIMFAGIILIYILSVYYTRQHVRSQFNALNKEIKELEAMEQ